MRHFGLDVTLATTMVGANPGYFHEGFYMENMEEDQCRVTQLFEVSIELWSMHVLLKYKKTAPSEQNSSLDDCLAAQCMQLLL